VAERYQGKAVRLRSLQLIQIRTLAEIWAVIIAQPQAVLSVAVLGGAVAVHDGVLSLGTLVAFISLYLLLVWPIESMGWLLAASQEANTAAERIFEVLDSVPTIRSTAQDPAAETNTASKPDPTSGVSVVRSGAPAPASASVPTVSVPTVSVPTGVLVFEHASFTYLGSDRPILTDLNLSLGAGEAVAIVGPTGCGKTTLTALVPRLYDVTEGRILVNGTDIRQLPLERLRTTVACAFEEPTLFSASVRENLLLGRPDADESQVAEALRVAQAEFVLDLPWGLDTRVGEQGLSLSGGQRQRLALARAVLGRPEILVLDDPLSALDIHTEGLVEAALRSVLAKTTALVVAHRASTVLLADRVAMLGPVPGGSADGARGGFTIVATGTHLELLDTSPEYRSLLSQSSDLEPAR
jgi:ATP-binding cassette subfamily B protein